ncbi:MAG: AAA family ATPase [Actinobacteria bacterium]|nr:AAA family ATPase [Actinomycetota bacterium]
MTARVIAFANQKGGVGKTTSALTVAAAMAELDRAVLVIDLDPQACLTFSLGYDPDSVQPSLHDTVVGRAPLVETIVQHREVDLAPSNIDLAGAEVTLLSRTGREYLMRGELAELLDSYDRIIIDCPPSLGVLTINGLTAADEVVIPVQCETLSHRGVAQLLETIQDVKRLTNRTLETRGIIATLFDPRTNHSRDVLRDLLARYGLPLIGPPVRKSIRFAEAPTEGASVLRLSGSIPGAAAYRAIARELLGLPVPPGLYEDAGWDDERRDDVLGTEEEVSGGSTTDTQGSDEEELVVRDLDVEAERART